MNVVAISFQIHSKGDFFMEFHITGGNRNAKITLDHQSEQDGILSFDVNLSLPQEEIPETFRISFEFPIVDIYSTWGPAFGANRELGPNWSKRVTRSRLASFLPLHSLLSVDSKNRLTIALSDAKTPTSIATGVCEETAKMECVIAFFTEKVAPLQTYTATVRLDTRDIPFYDSLYDVVAWWKDALGYPEAYVPEHARLPINSLWYSYHQALDVEDILRECELSRPLGMHTVIVDDGWQTDDGNRGYSFCGDWEVAASKIPDMKDFVARVHATGMKFMLWYSVPFVGKHAKNYEKFKDMLLDNPNAKADTWALDVRYKEVRDFLVNTYVTAVKEWGLDGLKLDFIDSFVLYGKSLENDPRRDYQSLEDAIDVLMTEITQSRKAINPEILIEFRQSYVGPAIRKYGNMLRVGDCPNDAIMNRQGVLNLRFTSGSIPVHSDMLLWNFDDPVEVAALQLVSVLYSVPQISVKIAQMPADHKKMLTYYLAFWREYRDVLLDGKVTAENPESAYSSACSQLGGRAVVTVYTDTVVDGGKFCETVVVNGSKKPHLLKNAAGRSYRVVNCMGEELTAGTVPADLFELAVPTSGMVFVK